jgi:hypothetical protein
LGPIIDAFEQGKIEDFLTDFRSIITDRAGMGHAILPMEDGSDHDDWLEAMFDVIVEVRSHDGIRQERWRLPDSNHCTTWFDIDEIRVG